MEQKFHIKNNMETIRNMKFMLIISRGAVNQMEVHTDNRMEHESMWKITWKVI